MPPYKYTCCVNFHVSGIILGFLLRRLIPLFCLNFDLIKNLLYIFVTTYSNQLPMRTYTHTYIQTHTHTKDNTTFYKIVRLLKKVNFIILIENSILFYFNGKVVIIIITAICNS